MGQRQFNTPVQDPSVDELEVDETEDTGCG